MRTFLLVCAAAAMASMGAAAQDLKAPEAFSDIANQDERSVALFAEAGKVILSPRCSNCHPAGNRPFQGDDEHPHVPAVQRGEAGMGVPGLYCTTCHQTANFDAGHVPGNPKWSLAPADMAWHGKTLAAICVQIKDPARNGGRSLAELTDHMAHDELVGWAWHPDSGRTPALGTQAGFGRLIAAWVATGAACPRE
jgi:hypothetical protein